MDCKGSCVGAEEKCGTIEDVLKDLDDYGLWGAYRCAMDHLSCIAREIERRALIEKPLDEWTHM